MKRKLAVLAFVGGLLVLILRRLGKGAGQLVAPDPQMEFWSWFDQLCTVHHLLDECIKETATFGDQDWEEHVSDLLRELFRALNHYPNQVALGFAPGFDYLSQNVRSRIHLERASIQALIIAQVREGMDKHSQRIGDWVESLNRLASCSAMSRAKQQIKIG